MGDVNNLGFTPMQVHPETASTFGLKGAFQQKEIGDLDDEEMQLVKQADAANYERMLKLQ